MKKTIAIVAILSLVGGTAAILLGNKKEAEQKVYRNDPDSRVFVQAEPVAVRPLTNAEEYLGTFEPNREIRVLSEVAGKVLKVGVSEGQFISTGQLLAKVDDAQMRLQLKAAEVNLKGQQTDVDRYTELAQGDAIPAMNLEKAELGVEATQVQMEQLRDQMARTAIKAPFSGIVTLRMFDLGTVLAPGAPLIQLTDISTLKLVVNVPEKDILRFRVGQRVPIRTDVHPSARLTGEVAEIGIKGDAAHNYPVKIRVANSATYPLKAGMYGSVSNKMGGNATALTVPRTALVGSTTTPQIYVVENGKAMLRTVQTGLATDKYIEVKAGLTEGERVVVSGQSNLENGTAVTIK